MDRLLDNFNFMIGFYEFLVHMCKFTNNSLFKTQKLVAVTKNI